MDSQEQTNSKILKAYIHGFLWSLALTLAAYYCVELRLLQGFTLILTIVGLGVVQAIFQLIYFLHLGEESKPKWNALIFFFMLTILLILVIGSLWIMYHLNYREMPPMDMHMLQQEGL